MFFAVKHYVNSDRVIEERRNVICVASHFGKKFTAKLFYLVSSSLSI